MNYTNRKEYQDMKKILCFFLSMLILLSIVNIDTLRINSLAEDDTLEYATVEVITNNIAENDVSDKVGESSQIGVDISTPKESETTLIKKNDRIYMSLDDICKFTRTYKEETDNKYILKQGLLEITVLVEANGNAKIKSLYGEFNTHTIIENEKVYCEPEPLMSMLFADCTYHNNILLIDLPQYTVYEAINFDYTKYQSDVTNFGIDDNDNMITGLGKYGLTVQRLYVSYLADIIVDCNYGFFATDNTTRQYYYEAFNEALGYDIYSNEVVKEEEAKRYEKSKELSSFLEKTKNGDISDTPFTDFYISSYIDTYAQKGLKDSSSLSMFNDTIRDLSTNGRLNEKLNSSLNEAGKDVLTNILFNSILEYIKRSSYDRKVLQMFKTLYSDETVNKYNVSLSKNGKFFFQCAKDYYNSCGSFDNIIKEVTLNESINKFYEIILKGAFYLSTGGKSQEVFETYETILTAEKLRESNNSFEPIEKINNSAKYFWLAKMQDSTIITLDKIHKKANESLNSEDIENFISNLDFYNRVSAVMIKTLADSYQLPTATEREKDLMAHSDEYIKELCRNTYKLEYCEYNLPTKEDLNNKTCDVFKKFFTAEPVETTTTTQTIVTTSETITITTTTITTPTEDNECINENRLGLGYANCGYLSNNGTMYIWGNNWNGQLGNGTNCSYSEHGSLIPVKVIENIKQIGLGYYQCGAVTNDGELYMWGNNTFGQLGNGTSRDSLSPKKIFDNVKQFKTNYGHSAALTENGELYLWGYSFYGQVGNGKVTPYGESGILEPVKVMDNVKHIALGTMHSAAITDSGELYLWGSNENGQLGNGEIGSKKYSTQPIKIMDNISQVSLGSVHSAALTENGELYMWGSNESGQLGDKTIDYTKEPVKIMDNVKQISLGYSHSAVIKTDGSLYVWGSNTFGQIGDGTNNDIYSPVKILNDVRYVCAGYHNTVALDINGDIYVWGDNEYGQLGNGTTENSLVPVKIDIEN